ncbi:uncharacterized protein LOC132614552 [Lycium barbarum]|uniref:uncharacterized protein LOC132614552 n=1 Tax=Lycium barbarum TaxID=112863 RepID=UPI00293EDEAF|nr:uncharacterized protein LOC132614552 [Lycium barbarum]
MEDSILRQKARIKWAEEWDSNMKYFHNTIKARRRRAQIYKIKDRNDQWVEGNAYISKAAIDHFSEIFTGNSRDMNLDFIRGCDNLVSTEDNYLLTRYPTAEEIKMAIDSMDPNSCAGPDGFNGHCFQHCWDIIKRERLSPALFIIAAETLSRTLNHLNQNDKFINFSMHKKAPQINHLSYVDDLVLFTSVDKFSIKLMMNLLRLYQNASGQEINNDKTFFITHSKTNMIYNRRIRRWKGYKQSSFPFTYLGCPIYSGRKRISYFSDISKKVLNKIAGWQGRFLSPGGKATIIKHVLQSHALHIFAALMPPVTTLYEIEMQWWRLRIEPSLWAQFIRAKYCQRSNLNSKIIAPKDSAAWKDLLHLRDKIEANISWNINSGNILFWWDNWTQQGSLYQMLNPTVKPGNVKVKYFLVNQQWELDDNPFSLSRDTLNLIKSIHIGKEDEKDQAIWNPNSNGLFTCSSAFDLLRNKRVSFFMWKLLKKNLPLDANLSRFNIDKGASCCCCRTACVETGNHVFAQSELAKQTWKIITRPLGISITGSTVQTVLWQCWRQKPRNIVHKFLLFITPMIIKVAIRKKFKSIDYTWNWSKVCLQAENFKAVITSKMIRWSKPIGNNWKLNTDGSYKENQNKARDWLTKDRK